MPSSNCTPRRCPDQASGNYLDLLEGAGLLVGLQKYSEVGYWRERGAEVDFVVESRDVLTAIEVKTGRPRDARSGLAAFADRHGEVRKLLVGGDGIDLAEFLLGDPGSYVA